MEEPNYYAIIPADVRYDKELKDKAKLLYGEICALSNKNGCCFASNSYFAQLYGVTNTTISLLVKELIDKGYLQSEIVYKDGTKEIEHRYLTIIKGGYLKNIKYPIKENLKDNNTSINNTSNNISPFINKIKNKEMEYRQKGNGAKSFILANAWAKEQEEFLELTEEEQRKILLGV